MCARLDIFKGPFQLPDSLFLLIRTDENYEICLWCLRTDGQHRRKVRTRHHASFPEDHWRLLSDLLSLHGLCAGRSHGWPVRWHLPLETIGLLAGIDRILNMARVIPNIVGDAAAAVVVAKSEGELHPELVKDED